MNISLPNWTKPLLTVAYSVSGYVIVEIPVVLNVLPATLDGYSTAGIAAGLGFVLSAAYYVHSHIKPYISSSTTTTSIDGSTANTTPSTTSPPTPFKLTVDKTNGVIMGSTINFSVSGGKPGGTWMLVQAEGEGNILGATQPIDASGNGSLAYTVTPASVIGGVLNSIGDINLYAQDDTGIESDTVSISS